MAEPVRPPVLAPDAAARLAEFARACKAAARAVSLYPGGHPAIGTTLGRLLQVSNGLTQQGPYRFQVMAETLVVGGAVPAKPDPAIVELAELLHRQLIGGVTLSTKSFRASDRAPAVLTVQAGQVRDLSGRRQP